MPIITFSADDARPPHLIRHNERQERYGPIGSYLIPIPGIDLSEIGYPKYAFFRQNRLHKLLSQGGHMLVLTRKVDEQINIGGDIIIRIVEINKGSVRLGIEAPSNVAILRQEVYERVREENLASSRGVSDSLAKAADIWRKKSLKE